MSITFKYTKILDSNGETIAYGKIKGLGRLNLLSKNVLTNMVRDLTICFQKTGIRCVVLEGDGIDAFIGGAHLEDLRSLSPDTARIFIGRIHEVCDLIRHAEVPVVAAMRGYCLGAGLEIAASCDFRYGDASVKCGMPEVRVGVPSVVEAAMLPGLVGWGKAKELMLRGHIVDSNESLKIGILQQLFNKDELSEKVKAICDDMILGGQNAISKQKKLFRYWEDNNLSRSIQESIQIFSQTYSQDEPKIMISNFFQNKEKS
tara:strand:- start:760 stop:1539 length:780 start_codon:yes stop_codon:yes gene_type:complete